MSITSRRLSAIPILSFAAAFALSAGETAVPAPTALPDDNAYLVAIIPDLRAALGHAEQIAESFNPGKTKAGAMVTQVGAMLGDPELANFAGKPLMVAVGPGAPTPSFALLLPGKDAQLYLDAAAQRGLLMGKVVDGLAVVAQTPDGQALGEHVAAAYGALTAKPISGDLRLLVAPDRLVATYGAFLANLAQMGAKQAPKQPGAPDIAKILGLELATVFAVLGETSGVQIDLDLANGTVKVDERIAAKPDSALAKAFVAPDEIVGKRVATRFPDAPALMSLAGRLNIKAQFAYIADLLGRLQARPEAKDLITPDVIDLFKSSPVPWTGDLGMRIRMGEPTGMVFDIAYGSSDAAQARATYERIVGLVTGDGPLGKFYQSLGLTMTYTKAARSSAGVQIDRVSAVLDTTKLPPDQVEAMKAMARDSEVAFGKDWTVVSQDPKALDALIAGAGPGLTTKAEQAIGPGRQCYVDVDVIGFVRMQMRMLGDKVPDMARKVLDQVVVKEPATAAFGAADGHARIELRVPLAPFVEMAKGFREQAQAKPNGKQPPADGAGNAF